MACMHNAQTKANKQASTLSLKSLDHFGLNNEADCLTFPASYSAPYGNFGTNILETCLLWISMHNPNPRIKIGILSHFDYPNT